MPYFTQEIEIDLDDFLNECTDREIEDIVEALVERGYLKPKSSTKMTKTDFLDMLIKIENNRHQLTNEDEESIVNIYKKIV